MSVLVTINAHHSTWYALIARKQKTNQGRVDLPFESVAHHTFSVNLTNVHRFFFPHRLSMIPPRAERNTLAPHMLNTSHLFLHYYIARRKLADASRYPQARVIWLTVTRQPSSTRARHGEGNTVSESHRVIGGMLHEDTMELWRIKQDTSNKDGSSNSWNKQKETISQEQH